MTTHPDYDVVVSMPSIGQYMGDGSLNWVGNDRYVSYVKLYPGRLFTGCALPVPSDL
ncbi:MAG: hypothetical protein LBH77_07565 [Tannerella sp.]|nr:hypothetical protein [Tannerella sp.]